MSVLYVRGEDGKFTPVHTLGCAIDETLSQEGAAADAKATGNAINDARNDVNSNYVALHAQMGLMKNQMTSLDNQLQDKAPAGFGYGEPIRWLGFDTDKWAATETFQADLKAAFESLPQGGSMQVQFIDTELNQQKHMGTLWKYTSAYGFLASDNYSGVKAIKTYYNGVWNKWEYFPKSICVTPQMFGAVADDDNDDTAAVKAAIATGYPVHFPKGTYLITSTLTINGGVHLCGSGIQVSTIKYTGSGYLFHIKAEYKNHPVIEKMNFIGGTNNSFIKCISDGGNWGGCFTLRDFHVQYFNVEWMRLISAFKVLVENGSFKTYGKCVMTTYDGLPTYTNFNNCITFRNCLISCVSYKDDKLIPVMFELFNVRSVQFEQCALEKCDVMFKDFVTTEWQNSSDFSVDKNLNRGIVMNECWIEAVNTICSFTYDSQEPITSNCRFTDVGLYDSKTSRAAFNSPLNTHVKQVHGQKSVTGSVKSIITNVTEEKVGCRFVQTIIFAYAETGDMKSSNIWQAEWFCYAKKYYLIKDPVRVYTYGSKTAAEANEIVEKPKDTSGILVATTDKTAETIAIVTEYYPNGITCP